jgi:flagellar biosynthetic protein FliR
MHELAAFSTVTFWAFLLVFARVSALFVTAPVFGSSSIPIQTKVGLALILTFVMVPSVTPALGTVVPIGAYAGVAAIIGQVIIGIAIGFVVSLTFEAVRVAGNLLDFQMGFSQAAVFNPQIADTVTPVANFQYQYAIVLYLLGNGHWLLIAALQRSFQALPVARLSFGAGSEAAMADLTFQMLLTAIQIAAPAAAVLLITDIAFAFLNRAVPQMQVYFVGMPVKILVGLAVLVIILPTFSIVVGRLVAQSGQDIFTAIHGMRHA